MGGAVNPTPHRGLASHLHEVDQVAVSSSLINEVILPQEGLKRPLPDDLEGERMHLGASGLPVLLQEEEGTDGEDATSEDA